MFFVLSGYVIAYTTDHSERTARAYLTARLARLWSVLVPALLLTIALDVLGRRYGTNEAAYAGAPFDWPVIRIGATLAFVGESWVSIQPLSNGVTWSLCCEFWYYMVFAAWTFAPRGHWRAIGVTAALAMGGFKAFLLLPIWLFGVALQRLAVLRRLPPRADVVLFAASAAIIGVVLGMVLYNPAIDWMRSHTSPFLFTQLAQARVFWFDWLLGLCVAAHLLSARTVATRLPLERLQRLIKWCAGVSFAAYLIHVPLYYFWAAWLPRSAGWLAIGLTLVVIGLVGPQIERSKRGWRRALDQTSNWLLPVLAGARMRFKNVH